MSSNPGSFGQDLLQQIEDKLRENPSELYDDEGATNAWDDFVLLQHEEQPGMATWDEMQLEITALIDEVVQVQAFMEIKEFWITETSEGLGFQVKRHEMTRELGEMIGDPDKAQMTKPIVRKLWTNLIEKAKSEADRREAAEEEFESARAEPKIFLEEILTPFLRSKMARFNANPRDTARLAQWVHVCASIPFYWPPEAAPRLELKESGTGNSLLKLSYDGERLQIHSLSELSEPELLFELARSSVKFWEDDRLKRLRAAGLEGAGYDFTVRFPDPISDIPTRFW